MDSTGQSFECNINRRAWLAGPLTETKHASTKNDHQNLSSDSDSTSQETLWSSSSIPLRSFPRATGRNRNTSEGNQPVAEPLMPFSQSRETASVFEWTARFPIKRTGLYCGPTLGGMIPHGSGTIRFRNGDVYNGPFLKGEMKGVDARYESSDGSRYEGGFAHDLKDGYGEEVFPNGSRFVGRYVYGFAHGFGIKYNPDGSIFYAGRWKNGKPLKKNECEHSPPPFFGLSPDRKLSSQRERSNTNTRQPSKCSNYVSFQSSNWCRSLNASPTSVVSKFNKCNGLDSYENARKQTSLPCRFSEIILHEVMMSQKSVRDIVPDGEILVASDIPNTLIDCSSASDEDNCGGQQSIYAMPFR